MNARRQSCLKANKTEKGKTRARAYRHVAAVACLAWTLIHLGETAFAEADLPKLYTNEQFIEDVTKPPSLDINDTKAVLAYVLSQLPARVHVLPTENYYYFYFYHGGIKYAGNFRFDVGARDEGFIEFIYFKDTTDWLEDEEDHHATLGKADGVALKKTGGLTYQLTFGGKNVTFELNDLSKVAPPAGSLGADEFFLGPVADESGMRFFLIFDRRLKIFHYLLDESAPVADELVATQGLHHVLIGRRTGFAFFRDDGLRRKLLVGVYAPNIDVNNYLDGPFDQLPDNFLEGDELRAALLEAFPDIDEPIDRLGISPDGKSRKLIAPYMEYVEVEELAQAEKCAAENNEAARRRCLNALAPD